MIGSVTATYSGSRGALFGLAFRSALLTVLTLGIYRFWAKTRIRRYIWSSVGLDGDRLEYTGTGLEKFIGFLVAVVVLAIYLGLVQVLLLYFGLHFVVQPRTEAEQFMQLGVFYLSFLAILPLILFARYRARRYVMARTRFRGIRFGMEAAAWGYVWRALAHGTLTLLTLGILLPRQTFWLEKYKTDRTWFGDKRFEQGGRWTQLYPAMRHLFIAAALIVAGVAISVAARNPAPGLILGGVGYVWGLVGYVDYRVKAFRYLTDHKTLNWQLSFRATPRTGTVIGTYLLGGFLIGLAASLVLGVAGGIAAATVGMAGGVPGPVTIGTIGIAYLAALALIWALQLTLILQPLIAHFAASLSVRNLAALDAVNQRAADAGADAGGFADALDVGAAI
jgi:uncharacterized membrane protein YjgN (DUF898 family)